MTDPLYRRRTVDAGARAQVRKTITVADQSLFTGISGNLHPLYVNELHAREATQGGRLAFELGLAALASNALAELAGPYRRIGAIALTYPVPARVGDTVAAQAEVLEVRGSTLHCRVVVRRDDPVGVVAEGTADLVEV
jgi:3-hydroxybutyryl-CoA dehydratase